VEAVLEGLGIERAGVIAWSGGALDGVRAALGTERVSELHLIAGLVPVEAYEDPEIRDAASGRLDLIEVVEAYGAGKVAAMLAPCPCDRELALEYQREQRDPVEQARLAAIPGAVERMAEALVEGVRNGLGGVEADIKAQVRPLGGLPTETPTHLWYGTEDHIAPLAFGRWYAEHLPNSELHVVEDAGHFLPFTHWEEILGSVSRGLRGTAPLG
jgi:pimeloyl-ACP methyl ester carboxylesterase